MSEPNANQEINRKVDELVRLLCPEESERENCRKAVLYALVRSDLIRRHWRSAVGHNDP
jgi:hypothetical protein